jgi:hypothetical protein
MKEDTPIQDIPAYVERSSNKSKFIVFFVIIFAIVLAILAGLYFFGMKSKQQDAKVSPLPTNAISATATPEASVSGALIASPSGNLTPGAKITPTGKITPIPTGGKDKSSQERTKLQVAVLNGSGVPGAAKGISATLNSLGYTIATVGNAETFDYKNITIKVKKSKSAYLPILKKDVTDNAPNTPVAANVDDTIATDAEVIVGK